MGWFRTPSLLVVLACCVARPVLHPGGDYQGGPPPPKIEVDRPCEAIAFPLRDRCALAGNRVSARATATDLYHLHIALTLSESVSGCGELQFTTRLTCPPEAPREFASFVQCKRECMPTGPGGGTCWQPAHQGFQFELESEAPLLKPQDCWLSITSAGGGLSPLQLSLGTSRTDP